MTHDAFLDDVAAYALGSLRATDAARVREHLRLCPQCAAEYAALSEATTALAMGAQACQTGENGPQVSAFLKGRIMRDVRATLDGDRRVDAPSMRSHAATWPAYFTAAACLAIALIATASNFWLASRLSQARQDAAAMQTMLADTASAQARRIAVHDGDVIVRDGRVYIAMHDMTQPPKGMVYQAWTLARGAKTVAPSLTFMPDAQGVAIVAVPMDARALAAVAVSVEPAGGSKAPTTKPIAFAAIE
ncbi:MAG TPA: anti-sigma factor [Candidatus Baltobacteraceae bacterium]